MDAGSQQLNKDACVNTTDGRSTSDKNLVNFGVEPTSFAGACVPGGLHAGLCHAFLVISLSTD